MITIEEKKYIQADDVITSCPIWCKGVRNGRELVKKKGINEKHYIYARNGDDGWNVSDGKSVKYDKVFIRKKYLDTLKEYTSEINNKNVKDKDGIEKAPDIIILDDDEKFHDDDGNIMEIETRGIREHDKIYFRVKDVSDKLEIKNLSNTLLHNVGSYVYAKDYKYFVCIDKNGISKKELFLTFLGMRKMIETSRHKFSKRTKLIMHKWLNQFDKITLKKYQTNIVSGKIISKYGIVYCVTSKLINCTKIGFWRGSINGLRARYSTYYGNNMRLHYTIVSDASKLEKICHKHFSEYRLENELFMTSHFDDYVMFIEKHKENIDYEKNSIVYFDDNLDLNDLADNNRHICDCHGNINLITEIEKLKAEIANIKKIAK